MRECEKINRIFILSVLLSVSVSLTGCGIFTIFGKAGKAEETGSPVAVMTQEPALPDTENSPESAPGPSSDEQTPETDKPENEKEEAAAVSVNDHVIDVYYLRDLKYENAQPPHFYCIRESFSVADEYEGLKKKLEEFDGETEAELDAEFNDFGEEIAEVREMTGDDPQTEYLDYHFGVSLALMRADTKVFSFTKIRNYVSSDLLSRRIVTGYNYDTASGRKLALTDIVTDTDALCDAVELKLSEEDYSAETFDRIFSEIDRSLKEAGNPSSESLSWTAGYEGLTFYFNTTVNYNVFSRMSGAFSVFLPYKAYPELFREEYTKTDYAYVQDITIGSPWSEDFWIDSDKDGEYEELCVGGTTDKTGFYTSLYAGGAEYPYNELEYGTAAEVSGFLTRDTGGSYRIYIQRNLDDGVISTDVYEAAKSGIHYLDSFSGSLRYTEYDPDSFSAVYGYTFTNPQSFRICTLNLMMGRNFTTGSYRTDESGLPAADSDYVEFDKAYYDIEPKEDLRVLIVDRDGNGIEEGILKKGTAVRPYRCSADAEENAVLDVTDTEGTIYRLEIQYDEEVFGWTFNGSEISRYFEGLAYY